LDHGGVAGGVEHDVELGELAAEGAGVAVASGVPAGEQPSGRPASDGGVSTTVEQGEDEFVEGCVQDDRVVADADGDLLALWSIWSGVVRQIRVRGWP